MSRIRTINNRSKLYEAILAKKSYLCVGLDPDPNRIPACFGSGVEAIEAFCISVILTKIFLNLPCVFSESLKILLVKSLANFY